MQNKKKTWVIYETKWNAKENNKKANMKNSWKTFYNANNKYSEELDV